MNPESWSWCMGRTSGLRICPWSDKRWETCLANSRYILVRSVDPFACVHCHCVFIAHSNGIDLRHSIRSIVHNSRRCGMDMYISVGKKWLNTYNTWLRRCILCIEQNGTIRFQCIILMYSYLFSTLETLHCHSVVKCNWCSHILFKTEMNGRCHSQINCIRSMRNTKWKAPLNTIISE